MTFTESKNDLLGGGLAVVACEKTASEAHIPAFAFGQKVVEIREQAFRHCDKLKKVTIEEVDPVDAIMEDIGLKEIGSNAFYGCTALKEILIPDTVSSIGWGAFSGCQALERAEWGKGVYMQPYAFSGCSSLREIPTISVAREGVFADCVSLTEVRFEADISEIDEEAFARTGIEKVCIPASVKRIHYLAFRSCQKLKEITFVDTQGWCVNLHHAKAVQIDVSDPIINAKRLAFADFDDGVACWYKL